MKEYTKLVKFKLWVVALDIASDQIVEQIVTQVFIRLEKKEPLEVTF